MTNPPIDGIKGAGTDKLAGSLKSFDTFDFTAIPSFNKPPILELARCEYVVARDNIIPLGNSGTGKTNVALVP